MASSKVAKKMGSRRGGCKRGARSRTRGLKEVSIDINSQVDAVDGGG